MSARWLQLGAFAVLAWPHGMALAQAPKAEREGGMLPPIVQVVAREPIDEVEMVVELIKAMPRTRDEMKPKTDLGDNFKVIRVKRDKADEPMKISSDEPAKPLEAKATEAKPVTDKNIVNVRRDEQLTFVPAEKQRAVSISVPPSTLTAPAVLREDKASTITNLPVRESAYGTWTMPAISFPTDFSLHSSVTDAMPNDTNMPTLADSNVGWIDSALPGTQARFRYDARWNNKYPDRAEFYTARNQQYFNGDEIKGRGFSIPESNIDMMEVLPYVEWAYSQRLSFFMEMPVRYIHPRENPSAVGGGDFDFGFKVAYFMMPDQVQTFQLRFSVPTGSPQRGLGVAHTVIEPSLLLWQKLTDKVTLEAELRNWIPVGGTNYSSYVLRYALGLSYDWYQADTWNVKPVTELIFWSVLRGKESQFFDTLPTSQETQDARGTIIESAWGLRGSISCNVDWYAGVSIGVTEKQWFQENMRLEVRWRY